MSGIFFAQSIIVTQTHRSEHKKYDFRCQLIRKRTLPFKPFDLTKFDDKHIGVSTFGQDIYVVEVASMVLVRIVKTSSDRFYGLAFDGDEFVLARGNIVAWVNPVKWEGNGIHKNKWRLLVRLFG